MERRKEFCGNYLPDLLFAGAKIKSELSLLKNRLDNQGTKIYVCQNRTCKMPVTSVKDALKQLREKA